MTHRDGTNRPDLAASAPGLTRCGRRGDEGAAPARGASASSSPATRFPAPVIFRHSLLAAAELVVWIVYLTAGKTPLA